MSIPVSPRLFAALAALVLLAGPLAYAAPASAQGATVSVSPAVVSQQDTFTLTFAGFAPREVLSVWLTLPSLAVVALEDVRANAAGGGSLVVAAAALPPGAHTVSARGNSSGRLAVARFELTPGGGAAPSPGVTITVDAPSKSQGECFTLSGTGYQGGETLATWLRLPDDTVTDLGVAKARADGSFTARHCTGPQSQAGRYFYTARGTRSGRTGIAGFELRRGDDLPAAATTAVLFADPPAARQLATIALVGGGFTPGETVSLWVTLPDGVALPLFAGITADGTFAEKITLPPLPVGRHVFTAYGQSSKQRAIAPFDLLPGGG